MVAATSIAIAPLADFTPSPNTRITVSSGRITKISIFRPKPVKNYLNNSQNYFRSVGPKIGKRQDLCLGLKFQARLNFYHYWCWRVGAQYWQKSVLVIIFLENTRELHKSITSTGANFWWDFSPSVLYWLFFGSDFNKRRTNVQQLTCNIGLSNSSYYLFFSFALIELKPFVFKWKVLGEKFCKSAKKCGKVWKLWNDFAL